MPSETTSPSLWLNLNENPRMVSWRVEQAVMNALSSLNRYPGDLSAFESRIADYVGQGFTADNITIGHGGSDVLHRIVRNCLAPGDEAIIPIPAFPLYALGVTQLGGKPVFVECDHEFTLDPDEVLAQVSSKTKLLYLTSPNNPSGLTLPQTHLDYLLERVPARVLVVFDEVYWHFAEQPDRARAYAHAQARDNIVILHSFSKAFGLAGLRLGYGICTAQTKTRVNRGNTEFRFNHLVRAAGEAALQDAAFVSESIALMQDQRQRLYAGLKAMAGIERVLPSQASFVSFRPVPSSAWVAAQLAERRIRVRELTAFHMPGWLRVSVGLPNENEIFLHEVQEVLARAS